MNNEYRFPIQSIRTLVQRHPASPCVKQQDTQLYANGPRFQGLDWAYWAMQMFQCWGWRCQMRRMWRGIAPMLGFGGGGARNSACTLGHQPHATHPHMIHRQSQEPLEAQVVPREAWTFSWCWVMLTTTLAQWPHPCSWSIGWGRHKRSHISAGHSVLYQLLYSGLRNGIRQHYKQSWHISPLGLLFCLTFQQWCYKNNSISAGTLYTVCECFSASVCVYDCASSRKCTVIKPFSWLHWKQKLWLSAKEAALCLQVHQRKNVFLCKSKMLREREKNVVEPPLGKWGAFFFAFLISFPHFIHTSVLSPLLLLCKDVFQHFSPDPSALISSSPPPLPSIWLFTQESFTTLVCQCDRSLRESYWEQFPESNSSRGEKRLDQLAPEGLDWNEILLGFEKDTHVCSE